MGKEYRRLVNLLGSIAVAPPIILYDDFSMPNKWTAVGTGTDYEVMRDLTKPRIHAAPLRLRTRATAAAQNDYVQILAYHDMPPAAAIEAQLDWELDDNSEIQDFHVCLSSAILGYYIIPGVRYAASANKWQYYSSAGAWADIPDGDVGHYEGLPHKLTLRIDMRAGTYRDLTVGPHTWDLSDYAYQTVGVSQQPYSEVYIRLTADSANRPQAWLHQLLIREID